MNTLISLPSLAAEATALEAGLGAAWLAGRAHLPAADSADSGDSGRHFSLPNPTGPAVPLAYAGRSAAGLVLLAPPAPAKQPAAGPPSPLRYDLLAAHLLAHASATAYVLDLADSVDVHALLASVEAQLAAAGAAAGAAADDAAGSALDRTQVVRVFDAEGVFDALDEVVLDWTAAGQRAAEQARQRADLADLERLERLERGAEKGGAGEQQEGAARRRPPEVIEIPDSDEEEKLDEIDIDFSFTVPEPAVPTAGEGEGEGEGEHGEGWEQRQEREQEQAQAQERHHSAHPLPTSPSPAGPPTLILVPFPIWPRSPASRGAATGDGPSPRSGPPPSLSATAAAARAAEGTGQVAAALPSTMMLPSAPPQPARIDRARRSGAGPSVGAAGSTAAPDPALLLAAENRALVRSLLAVARQLGGLVVLDGLGPAGRSPAVATAAQRKTMAQLWEYTRDWADQVLEDV